MLIKSKYYHFPPGQALPPPYMPCLTPNFADHTSCTTLSCRRKNITYGLANVKESGVEREWSKNGILKEFIHTLYPIMDGGGRILVLLSLLFGVTIFAIICASVMRMFSSTFA